MNVNLMTIDPIAFEIGPLSVAWYGLIIVFGMILAVYLTIKEGEKRGISEDTVVDTAFWILPLGILGARLYYVLFELDYYLANPLKIFAIWEGGLAIYGGVIAGILVILWRARKDKFSFLLFAFTINRCFPPEQHVVKIRDVQTIYQKCKFHDVTTYYFIQTKELYL